MKRLLLLTALVLTAGILFAGLIELCGFPMAEWWYTDTIQQILPFFAETRRIIAEGFPMWTWNALLGDNVMGQYAYYTLFNPFAWFVSLFPTGYLGWGMIACLYLKTLLTAACAYLYLRRLDFSKNLCTAGALMYTLTSYYITSLIFFIFIEPVMLFALLLWAVEGTLRDKRLAWPILSAVTAAVIVVNYYFAVPSLLCGAIYFIVRVVTSEHIARKPLFIVRGVGAVLVGVGLSAFMLLPVALYISEAPRMTSEQFNFPGYILTVVQRLYFMLVPRLSDFFPTGMLDYTATVTVFIPAAGVSAAILWTWQHPRHWSSVMVMIFTLFYFTPLSGIFTMMTSLAYQRWSYAYTLMLIVATLYLISQPSMKIPRRYGIFYIIAILAAAMLKIIVTLRYRPTDFTLMGWITLGFGLVCGAVTFYCIRQRYRPSTLIPAVVGVAIANFMLTDAMFALNTYYLRERNPEYAARMWRIFNGEGFDEAEGPMTYRTDIRNVTPNQNVMENRPGITSYNSGVSGVTSEIRQLLAGSPVNQMFFLTTRNHSMAALFSMKYFRESGLTPVLEQNTYRPLPERYDTVAGFRVYQLPHYIPMGMAYTSFVPKSEYQALYSGTVSEGYAIPYVAMEQLNDSIDLWKPMLDNLVVEDADTLIAAKWLKRGHINLTARLDSLVEARRAVTAEKFEGNRRGFTVKFNSPQEAFYFLSVPDDPGFTLSLDGEPIEPLRVNLGMMGVPVAAGSHLLTASYTPPGMRAGTILSAVAAVIWLAMAALSIRKTSGARAWGKPRKQ